MDQTIKDKMIKETTWDIEYYSIKLAESKAKLEVINNCRDDNNGSDTKK